jgi:hypothetical protein
MGMRKMRRIAVAVISGLFALSAWSAVADDPVDIANDGADDASNGSLLDLAAALKLDPVCDWRPANGTPTATTQPGALRWGYVELAAGYYQLILSPYFPVGTRFRIDGEYPAARYISYQLYDGPKGGLGFLPDYQIKPNPGYMSPFTGINTVNTAIKPGGHYSVHIVYGARPATPAPNTLYVTASNFSVGSLAVFIYRVYNAFNGVSVADHGGVPLPTVVEETSQGDVAVASLDNKAVCGPGVAQRDTRRRARAAASDIVNSQPERPGPIPAQPVPAAPQFLLRDDPKDVLVNNDNRYIYVKLSQKPGDLVLMRARAPTFATGPNSGSDPQLRHWSVCENAWTTVETYSCIEDSDAAVDSDGFFNIVISVPTKKPANATHAHGFDWLAYGTAEIGTPILRHMLASPSFTQSAFAVPSGDGANAPAIMGEYFPVSTYCAGSVFQTHTAAGQSPKQVFAACAAGK